MVRNVALILATFMNLNEEIKSDGFNTDLD